MKMILSGGGTAGHIYPALALADQLRDRGCDLLYVGTPSGPEAQLAAAAGLEFVSISAAGFDRARPLTLATSSAKLLRGLGQARSVLQQWTSVGTPCAAVCFGGYVSIPAGLAASLSGIPLIIHEQNAHMGMTNRFLARRASLIALTYPTTAGLPRVDKLRHPTADSEFIGNPVRSCILAGDAARGRAALGIAADAKVLLVFGGSRGARAINQAIVAAAETLLTLQPNLHIVHSTGPLEYDRVREDLARRLAESDLLSRYHALDYIDDMGDVLAASDLVVARAGATSIAELTALGKPSVLVPYPFATDDHQTLNAKALLALGGARLVKNDQLQLPLFADTVVELLADDALRGTMAQQAATLGKPDAAAKLADKVMAQAKPLE
ncbi:MAG: undecaprenyldiphospho-muramoylpentapeptide beta-N-acetylglucosaminyltransferase [Coriobacteriia bacterium]|nr:undecaprenyldiphospho-muramoylpentapeptide beta-N-acetylglucosaminyltransferase [Coriobacteriia bacterium]